MIKPLFKRLSWDGNRSWTLMLMLLSAAVLWFLSHNHTFVPMWVEGMGECIQAELIMLGFDKQQPGCWLHIGTLDVPLMMNPHIGPAWFYAYAPTAYLWFHKFTTDPYIYRYTGIVFFLISAWLFYYLLRNIYKPSLSFYTAAAFLTSPLFLLGSLTDYELINIMPLLLLLTVFLFTHYIKGGSVVWLLASAMTLGMTLQTRVEIVAWLTFPFAIYLLVARPSLILNRWRQTTRKPLVVLSALGLFCLGAAPVIAANFLCPEFNVFSFIANSVVPRSFNPSMSLGERLVIRTEQFWNFNLLNIWPMFELRVANYTMAILEIVCLGILALRWVRKRHASLPLVMVPTIIVLSILSSSSLKNEHLNIMVPLALVAITSALAYVEESASFRKIAHIAFILLIVGNLTVTILDWRRWNQLPPNSQTMINQSDAPLLTNYLSEHYADDRILYTNVGMNQYVQYMTVGQLKGEDIMDWVSVNGFVNSVKQALLDKSRKRVFVAVSKEHDGLAGSTPRTRILYNLLEQYNVRHEVIPLSNERNSSLYDLIVVEAGVTLSADFAVSETLVVPDFVDVRVEVQPSGDSAVIGSILGAGFKPGDAVRINSESIFPATYGTPTLITFSIPLKALGEQSSPTLEVVRMESLERSKTFTVRFPR